MCSGSQRLNDQLTILLQSDFVKFLANRNRFPEPLDDLCLRCYVYSLTFQSVVIDSSCTYQELVRLSKSLIIDILIDCPTGSY